MSVFKKWIHKVVDFPTGNLEANRRERLIYEEIEKTIENIEDLLNCYVTEDTLQENPELYQKVLDHLQIYKNAIDICYKQMRNMTNSLEIRDKQLEINRLEYYKALEPVKNEILTSSKLSDLNQAINELIIIINGNARCKPFQGFIGKKVWTINDLSDLRNAVAKRSVNLIDYNGKMR